MAILHWKQGLLCDKNVSVYCDSYFNVLSVIKMHQLFTTQSRLTTILKKKGLENTAGKGENSGNQPFLLFPQYFLLFQSEKLAFQQFLFVVCKCFDIAYVQKFVVWERVKPPFFPRASLTVESCYFIR